ncbi:zinc finger protein 37-like isoform X3 [Planococcus citri]|uniref:zinc finger protein 37-like isoform X3 n=1 Tax=Planococcus citri TaxID=170843 RepID=UPI0031F91C67
MDSFDSFSAEKSEQGMLRTSSDPLSSNQLQNDISFKIENDGYPSDQENEEPYEIQDETDDQRTKNEDMCVACGYISANEFFVFPFNVDIRQQWAKFCDINVDKIKLHFRLCDGHFKPEDYEISMQRKVLKPTSVPTLRPKVKHNFTPSITQSFQFGADVISFSMPKSNINTSRNTTCSSDFEKNTTTADAPNKRLSENFKDITNNQDTIPPKAAKSTSKKNLKHEKCQLSEKHLRTEIFRLKIRCSRLEDTVANFENKIKQQVEECFVTRTNTAGNVAKDIQNSTSSINASSENSRNDHCNKEARTDQRSVKEVLVGSAEQVTEDGYITDSSMPSVEMSIDGPQKVEVKQEIFTEEVMLDEPTEQVAEDNHSVSSTIPPREISTDRLLNAKAILKPFSIRVTNAETSINVTSNSSPGSTEDPLAQDFEKVSPAEHSYEDIQSPNSTIPSSEKSFESRNNAEARAGCSKNQENSGRRPMPRSAKQKKPLPSEKKSTTRNSGNVSNKVKVQTKDSFPYCCDTCGKMISCQRDWSRHQQEHSKPFRCQNCGKQFASKSDLIAHGLTKCEKKNYKCGICDARFKCKRYKLEHERRHVEEVYFECAICGKKLGYRRSFIDHLRIHSDVKQFSCQTCSKSFAQKLSLTRHQRTHIMHGRRKEDRAYFECAACGKKLSHRRSFTEHLRTHSGVKPFSCHMCSKSFTHKHNLTHHQRTHSEERSFKCRICNQQFKHNRNRVRHERAHVEGNRFECAHCGIKLRDKYSLAKHILSKCITI